MRHHQSLLIAPLLLLVHVHAASIAVDVANLPACGLPCWTSAINKSGCGLTDYACQCSTSNSNLIVPLTGNCLLSSCSSADTVTFAELSDDICSQISLSIASTASATATGGGNAGSSAAKTTTTGQYAATASAKSTATGDAASITTNPGSSSTSGASQTSTPSTSSNGLSTGAIAGIAVGGVVVIALIVLAILLYRRRSKRKAFSDPSNPAHTSYGPDKTGDPELMSPGNAHELDEKSVAKYELQSPASELHSKNVLPVTTELYSSPITPAPAELYSDASAFVARKPVPSREIPNIQLTTATPTTPASAATAASVPVAAGMVAEEEMGEGSQDDGKLAILRERIDKIRDEKARLERLQELKDLEEQTKREIMMEQRKGAGF